jgi:hypothetical protein
MTEPSEGQAIFERYLREALSLTEAADALEALIRERKAAGTPVTDLALRRPDGITLSQATVERGADFVAEMNRRAAAT